MHRYLQKHLQTTPLHPDTIPDQGFCPDLTMDGILEVHPSDTPQNPRSQACGFRART